MKGFDLKNIKKVLWATDFSRESKSCLQYIKFLNNKLNIKVYASYILPKFSDWVYETAFFSNEDIFREIEKTKIKAMKSIETCTKRHKIDIESIIVEGIASEELINIAEEKGVDMIFAGRRGISEIEEILIGSTTSRLIRVSHKPVFIVPKRKTKVDIKKILCPIDFNDLSMFELKHSIEFAKSIGADLYVVHISEFFNYKVPIFERDKLIASINSKISNLAKQMKYEIKDIIYDIGEPAHKIIEISKKEKADLIIMATHQRKGFEKFFLGSITEKVLMYSEKPILMLPNPDNE